MKKVRNKVLAMLLCLVLVIGVLAVSAIATDEVASGTCGENVKWVLTDDGNLTIFGRGKMHDYEIPEEPGMPPFIPNPIPAPWYDYRTQIKTVVIENGVTEVGEYAFYRCSELTDIIIADSVTTIKVGVFKECTALAGVTLPNGLTDISSELFFNCTSLTDVTIPETVTSIQSFAFQGCESLKNLVIPKSVTELSFYAFDGCASLTEVTIPASVECIRANAFANCGSLMKINVAKDNEYYCNDESGVLYNKDKTLLVQVPNRLSDSYVIPNSVTKVEGGAFEGCTRLTSITVPASVTELNGFNTFGTCTSLEEIIVHEDNANYMSDESFVLYNKDKTTLIEAPRRIAGSYVIPDGVIVINRYAFENCDSLTDVTISASVSSVDFSAFGSCDNLRKITVHEDNQYFFNDARGALYKKQAVALVQVPGGLSGSYTVIDNTDIITGYSFNDCDKLTEIIIPDSVTYIGSYAFKGCIGINEIIIPENIEIMEDYVFMNCKNLRVIRFLGDAPNVNGFTYETVKALGFYPENNDTWQKKLSMGIGENITWIPYTLGAELPYIKGDVNLDGKIANTDLIIIARYIVGHETNADIKKYGDMDGDGNVTNSDLITIARIIVGAME